MDCNQQDPSSNKKEIEMDSRKDNQYKLSLEQTTLMGPDNHDVEGASVEGEWQIPTLGALPKQTRGFSNRNFRNPSTGESIIPTQVYVELQREVQQASQPYQWKFLGLGLITYVVVVLMPFIIIDFEDVNSSLYFKIACVVGFVLFGFLVWKTGMQWMNKSLHARMERVVQEHQGKLLECGVTLGYSHETTACYSNQSHLWLQRSTRGVNTPSNSVDSSRDGEEEQLFPPIYIYWLVPGEIHINEKEYDQSMVLDRDVWTMIQQAHFGSYKPYHRYLAILMAALVILWFVYTIMISYFMYLFGNLEAWLGYFGLFSGFVLTWYILDQLNVKAWNQVAKDVTLQLLHHENPHLRGTALKFETSMLPFRNRPTSRRYQLVRVQGKNTHYSSGSCAVDDGEKVNHDDCDDEHHIL